MGVTIQEDMLQAARLLPDDQGRDLIFALVTFGIEGEEPSGDEPWYPMWLITKGRIDASVKRNRINAEMTERRLAKQAEAKSEDTDQRSAPKVSTNGDNQRSAPKDATNENDGAHQSNPPKQPTEVRKGEVRKGKEKGGRALKRFTPPSPDEVAAYAKEQCLNIDPVRFCDYYESCGWVVGRNRPMKDWKAAARRWSKNEYVDLTQGGDPDDYYDFSALDRRSMGDADADLPF